MAFRNIKKLTYHEEVSGDDHPNRIMMHSSSLNDKILALMQDNQIEPENVQVAQTNGLFDFIYFLNPANPNGYPFDRIDVWY